MATPTYESIKIRTADYDAAKDIRLERGLALVEAIGCAIEGWNKLSRTQQDNIIRERARRHNVETVNA